MFDVGFWSQALARISPIPHILELLMQLRKYEARDKNGCLEVFDSNVPDCFSAEYRPLFVSFLDDCKNLSLGALHTFYSVIENSSGTIIACAGVKLDFAQEIASFCFGMVRSDYQRRGIGRYLAKARLAAIANFEQIKFIQLLTSQKTIGFYEKMGFRFKVCVKDGIAPQLDAYMMTMQLDSEIRSRFIEEFDSCNIPEETGAPKTANAIGNASSDLMRTAFEDGVQIGAIREAKNILIMLGTKCYGAPNQVIREKIEQIDATETIEQCIARVIDVSRWERIFDQ